MPLPRARLFKSKSGSWQRDTSDQRRILGDAPRRTLGQRYLGRGKVGDWRTDADRNGCGLRNSAETRAMTDTANETSRHRPVSQDAGMHLAIFGSSTGRTACGMGIHCYYPGERIGVTFADFSIQASTELRLVSCPRCVEVLNRPADIQISSET